MTFILGMKCFDGLVICADTLESGGASQRCRTKVAAYVSASEWGVCWGVAGDAFVADKFSDKFKQLVDGVSFDRAKIELLIEKCLRFINEHYKDQSVSIVVGLFARPLTTPEFHLYRGDSETGCIAPVREYCPDGMDVTLAEFILRNTFHPFTRTDEAIQLGLFVTGLMKQYAHGVGGDTHLFSYSLGDLEWRPLQDTKPNEIDSWITELEQTVTDNWCHNPQLHKLRQITGSDIVFRNNVSRKRK